jgi:hypothetical protein
MSASGAWHNDLARARVNAVTPDQEIAVHGRAIFLHAAFAQPG